MIRNYETVSDLWHKTCDQMLVAKSSEIDSQHGMSTAIFRNVLFTQSMEFKVDIGHDMWMTKNRFTKLQRDYLYWNSVEEFINRADRMYHGSGGRRGMVTQLGCRDHGVNSGGHYAWGNCILGFTFQGGKKQSPHMSMHSRTCYLNYMGAFDLALAWVLGREISQVCDFEVEDIGFTWYIDSLQLHGLKGIPYEHSFGQLEKYIDNPRISHANRPSLRLARGMLRRLRLKHEQGIPPESEKMGPLIRMRTRYEAYLDRGERKPSVPLHKLNLDPLRKKSYD